MLNFDLINQDSIVDSRREALEQIVENEVVGVGNSVEPADIMAEGGENGIEVTEPKVNLCTKR